MPVDAFVITLLDEEAGEIDGTYVMDLGQRLTGIKIQPGQGLSGRVIESGESILTLDSAEADEKGAISVGEVDAPHSIVAVPINSGGKTVGMLSAQSYQFDSYGKSDLQILSTLANQASIAIQNGRLFAETRYASTLEQRARAHRPAAARQRNTETPAAHPSEVSASLTWTGHSVGRFRCSTKPSAGNRHHHAPASRRQPVALPRGIRLRQRCAGRGAAQADAEGR
jgi:GAF domain-containing protein